MQSPTPVTQNSVQKQNLYRVIYVALCGTVLFTAYCSIQSLISELYIQLGFGSLGRLCMLVYFGVFAFCSIVAPFYTKKMNAKTGLIFGTCCYTTFVLAGVLTTFCTKYEMSGGVCSSNFLYTFNLLAAAGVGVGASIYWLCQSTYVNSCADESTKGLFNGTFWSIFQLCQITSSTLATVILSTYDQFTFFSFLLIFCIASIIMLTFMRDPIQDQDIIQVASNNETEGGSIAETFYDFYMMMQERKYHGLCFGVFFSGLAIGCYIAFIGSAVALTVQGADLNELNKSIGMVLMVLAIGEISAGLSAGKVADMYNKFKVFTATMYINEAALVCTFLSCLFGSYKFALVCAFLWGYGDTSIQTMIGTLIGFAYGGKPILFSAYRVFQNFGIMCAILICILIPKSMPLLYVILMGSFMAASHYYYRINTPENGVEKKGSLLAKSEKTLIELEDL